MQRDDFIYLFSRYCRDLSLKIHNQVTLTHIRSNGAVKLSSSKLRDLSKVTGALRSSIGCNSSNGCWWSRSQQCGTDADSPAHCSAFWVNTNTANPRSWKILHQFPRVMNTRIQGTAVLWLWISYTTFIWASGDLSAEISGLLAHAVATILREFFLSHTHLAVHDFNWACSHSISSHINLVRHAEMNLFSRRSQRSNWNCGCQTRCNFLHESIIASINHYT